MRYHCCIVEQIVTCNACDGGNGLDIGEISALKGEAELPSTAATFWAVAAIGAASGLEEYAQAVGLTLVVFFAHVALRPLSAWIERAAPPEDTGPR